MYSYNVVKVLKIIVTFSFLYNPFLNLFYATTKSGNWMAIFCVILSTDTWITIYSYFVHIYLYDLCHSWLQVYHQGWIQPRFNIQRLNLSFFHRIFSPIYKSKFSFSNFLVNWRVRDSQLPFSFKTYLFR